MPRARDWQIRSFVAVACFLLFAGPSKAANEIEILSLSPASPATLDGISASLPMPGAAASSANSVTVVVRYRSEGAATMIEAFADLPGTGGLRSSIVPPTSAVPACGALSGASAGRCAAAFTFLCPAGSSASVHVERVGVALGIGGDTMTTLATDRDEADYTFVCPGPRPSRVRNCLVVGVAGEPGESELPIGRDLPLCRCLRDDGAREFRCGFLHPDFFLLRRVPIPSLLAGRQSSEEWSLLPLTKLDGPIRLTLSGSGLAQPFERVFGAETAPGVVERFSVPLMVSPGSNALGGRGIVEYETQRVDEARWRKFEFERSPGQGTVPPN